MNKLQKHRSELIRQARNRVFSALRVRGIEVLQVEINRVGKITDFKVAQNSNISVRRLGSSTHFSEIQLQLFSCDVDIDS